MPLSDQARLMSSVAIKGATLVLRIAQSFCQTELNLHIIRDIACIASVSAQVRRESWDESKKKKRNEGEGEGKGAKETLASKPHDFEKLLSPTNAAFDWCSAGSVD